MALGWPLDGPWMAFAWPLDGPWMGLGWPLRGPWMALGWALGGASNASRLHLVAMIRHFVSALLPRR
eukprot:6234281-Lingulodinium_polyedra.AAC.1